MISSRVLIWAGRSIIPAATGLFAIAFLVNIRDLDAAAVQYPNVIIPITLGLVLLNVVAEARTVGRQAVQDFPAPQAALRAFLSAPLPITRPVTVVAFVALFAYSIPRLGFYLSALGFLLAVPPALGLRSLRLGVGIALGVGLAAYLLFEVLLGLSLPRGGQ